MKYAKPISRAPITAAVFSQRGEGVTDIWLVLWFGIQRDKTGQRGEEGGEDTRLENGEVDEVVNYKAENAAEQGD